MNDPACSAKAAPCNNDLSSLPTINTSSFLPPSYLEDISTSVPVVASPSGTNRTTFLGTKSRDVISAIDAGSGMVSPTPTKIKG